MTSALYVAAGGGGDAIAAAIIASRATPGRQVGIATYAWDRLIIDPLPGPRRTTDFGNLSERAPCAWEITSETKPIPPAGSTLPRLAHELDVRLFLLDPYDGAAGVAKQVKSIARFLDTATLTLVDVGGDLVATGTEPELRSPLADTLALAACAITGLSCQVLVAAPGVDGELSQHQVLDRCRALQSKTHPALTASQASPFDRLFDWHPSEATGLWLAAALGHRGRAEVRDAGLPVALTDTTPHLYSIALDALLKSNAFVDAIMSTRTLTEVEQAIRDVRGSTELDYERQKASRPAPLTDLDPLSAVTNRIAKVTKAASDRADYLTVRRLAELVGFPRGKFERFVRLLRAYEPQRLTAPLWALR